MSAHHEQRNRAFWDADADDYQAVHGAQLASGKVWGVWAIPEAELGAVGDTRALDVLEYGCGAAQWSIALTRDGARAVGLDQSRAQLRHAAANVAAAGVRVPLLCASGEAVPLRNESFDLVLCDHGAMSFCDPDRSVPEIARLLRAGGRLVFNKSTILHYLCWDDAKDRQTRKLQHPYFEKSRLRLRGRHGRLPDPVWRLDRAVPPQRHGRRGPHRAACSGRCVDDVRGLCPRLGGALAGRGDLEGSKDLTPSAARR